MSGIKLNLKNTGISQKSIMEYKEQVENIHKELHKKANDEKDFVGWLELPTNYDKKEFSRIKKAATYEKVTDIYNRLEYFLIPWTPLKNCFCILYIVS